MGKKIKRKLKQTYARVIDENGDIVDVMRMPGRVSAPRMATVARRDLDNPLLTVRDVTFKEQVYVCTEEDFLKVATPIDDDKKEEHEGE